MPFASGVYDVKPGLRKFGIDLGNGEADGRVFQLDNQFGRYRQAKRDARGRRFDEHVMSRDFSPQAQTAVARFIVHRLVGEHPERFRLMTEAGGATLACELTGNRLAFDDRWTLVGSTGDHVDALDALACQVQEDMAVTHVDGGSNRLAALHVCMPSHWSPRQKLGGSFAHVHAPVPGMAAVIARQDEYVRQMVDAEQGMVRFVWGIQAGDALNRHPLEPSPAFEVERAFVRVERQTIWGLPDAGVSLFTIRPYLIPVAEVRADAAMAAALSQAVRGMSSATLAYKGLNAVYDPLLRYLACRATP